MSVTEISPREGEFERTPPHDIAAEQCVLGGMLLSKDAISDVLEVIRPHDHYRPAHQIVHEVILDLYSRGEPADAVTVAAELTKRGDITRMGGAPYLHTLIASVPTAANAGYYARIVRERAILRRLVEVGTRIVQLGYSGDGDADELLDRAEAEVYKVADRRVSEDYHALAEIMPAALDEIEAIGSRGGGLTGVPTGFSDLDALTNGLHPGQMIVIAARPALGKALALDTPLPTPSGWTTMGEVQVGDWLLSAAGSPTQVVAATEVMTGRPCYELSFDDGTTVIADAEHGWLTGTPGAQASVKTTAEIACSALSASNGRPAHSIDTAHALDLPPAELPVPPYTLGSWLGSSASGRRADPEVVMYAEAEGLETAPSRPGSLPAVLQELGILASRHIPAVYLRASQRQRRALLAGLLDAGGTVGSTGAVSFAVIPGQLAEDFRELLISLGYRADGPAEAGPVTFTTSDDVFRLERKRLAHKEGMPAAAGISRRYITAVRQVASQPVRCVQVDNADHLYLASRSMIPTHNSTLALDLARACSIKNGLASVIFSLEMGRNEITMRLLSAEARVPLHSMRTGQMGDEDWTRLARRMSEVVEAPLFIDDSPNMSMMEIRAKCRRLKQRQDLKLVIIDYLQLMSSPKRTESRQQEVSEMSRSLKLLAKELEVPVIAVAQLNRGPEQRTDKKPMLSDLRESGCLTQDTRILRADTGTEVTLGELMASGERNVPVWSLDEKLHLVPKVMTHAFSSGTREVFRVKLRSGREVQATANHPFLSFDGWMPLRELQPGSRVAIPRHVPAPSAAAELPEPEIILLAQQSRDDSLVPAPVFSLPSRQVALFLRHLWATDGCVWWDKGNSQARIYYASTSRRLVDDVAQLLLRSGILTRLKETAKAGYRPCYQLHIYGADNQLRFLRSIGVNGERAAQARTCLQMLESVAVNTNLDTVPREVWQRVRTALEDRQMPHRQFAAAMGTQFCGSTMWKHAPSRERLGRVATILDDAELDMVATNDVFWDEIASVTSLGEQPVFDATVPGTSNFVANGVSLHNSIEQDADMVILLHREDAYERESPRAGEADFIVAKHRNGPTATVTVAFQGHFSRFVDMAPS